MQNNYTTNLLRNSYGFQKNASMIMKSPTGKGFPMPATNHKNTNHQLIPDSVRQQHDIIPDSIRQQQAKLQGFEGLVKKKYNTVEQGISGQSNGFPKGDVSEHKSRPQFPMPQNQADQSLSQQVLRGSCSNILKKFGPANLRNTTHFNPIDKRNTQQQIRKSPFNEQKHIESKKNHAQDYAPGFLRNQKLQECRNSFVSPSRTPPKIKDKNGHATGRTPIKYKNITENSIKTSGMSKNQGSSGDKQKFKSLNEIIELKHKQKFAENAKNYQRSKVINGFQFGKTLGKGKFGEVFMARHHDTGFIAAIKKIEKKKVVQFKMVDQFSKEIRLHASLDHPNIVKFYGVFQQKDYIYLVMQYMNGGTLFDYLNEVPYLETSIAAAFLKDVVDALIYMHDKSIAHRDIKPENIVINSQGVGKLCDFGWSALVQTSRKTYCGTFDYAPPEILERKNYDASVDIWCIGVLTYELLTGRVPFEGEKRNQIMQKIVNVDKKGIDYPVNVPQEAREFIEALVQKDPALRPRSQDLLKYKFFGSYLPKGKSKKPIQ